MIKVLILFEKKDKKYLCDSIEMKRNFEELFEIGGKRGIKYFRSSISRYKNGVFKEAWVFINKKWKIEKNIKPDIVFDRSPYLASEIKTKEDMASRFAFANDLLFYQLGASKFLTYLVLKEFMPETRIAYSYEQIKNNLKFIKSKKVVIKPDIGASGKGVEVLNKKDLVKNKTKIEKFPVVVQEFIDSSKGVKGLIKGIHDFRIMFFNQSPFLSYIRQPKSGFVANFSRGGTKVSIPLDKIPKKLFNNLNRITKKLAYFNNMFYSIDFFFDKDQKYHIIEINPSPSIRIVENNYRKYYYKKLSEYFLEL